MKRIWFLVLAVSIGLNAGLVYMAVSKPGPVPGHHRPPRPGQFGTLLNDHLRMMAKSLDLDADQRAAVEAVHRELLPKIAEQHRRLEELRRSIGAHFEGPEFNATEFQKLTGALSEAQVRLDALVSEAMLGEAAVLTPDQRRKYAGEMPWGRRGAPPPERR